MDLANQGSSQGRHNLYKWKTSYIRLAMFFRVGYKEACNVMRNHIFSGVDEYNSMKTGRTIFPFSASYIHNRFTFDGIYHSIN